MIVIKRILHLIPFVHFYTSWSDTSDCAVFDYDERQKRHCTVCNKKQYRVVSPV